MAPLCVGLRWSVTLPLVVLLMFYQVNSQPVKSDCSVISPSNKETHMQTHTLSSDKQLQYVLLQYKNISDQGFSSIKDYTK